MSSTRRNDINAFSAFLSPGPVVNALGMNWEWREVGGEQLIKFVMKSRSGVKWRRKEGTLKEGSN